MVEFFICARKNFAVFQQKNTAGIQHFLFNLHVKNVAFKRRGKEGGRRAGKYGFLDCSFS